MSQEDFNRRLTKLEQSKEDLEGSINDLNTTIALLNQTVETMAESEEKRQQFLGKTLLFVVGGLISAVVAWVIRGGLGQ